VVVLGIIEVPSLSAWDLTGLAPRTRIGSFMEHIAFLLIRGRANHTLNCLECPEARDEQTYPAPPLLSPIGHQC
jgi:hypothetical protein